MGLPEFLHPEPAAPRTLLSGMRENTFLFIQSQCELKPKRAHLSLPFGLEKVFSTPSVCRRMSWGAFDIHKGNFSRPERDSVSEHTYFNLESCGELQFIYFHSSPTLCPSTQEDLLFSFYLFLFFLDLLRQHLASAPCRKVSH